MEKSIAIVEGWLASRGLKIAVQKKSGFGDEATSIQESKVCHSRHQDKPEEAADLAWCRGGRGLSFGPTLGKLTRKLPRLVPNVGGPGEKKRRLSAHVMHSIRLYAAGSTGLDRAR